MITRASVIARLAAVAACLAAGTTVLAQGPVASRKGLTLDGANDAEVLLFDMAL